MKTAANLTNSSTLERTFAAAGAAALLGGASIVAFFDPSTEGFFPVCPLFRLTGFACPGCGLTRGMHTLMHGDFLTALDFNALTPVFALGGVFFLVSLVLLAARGRGLRLGLYRPWMLWSFMVGMLVFGMLRNLPFYPVNILYP